MKLEKMDAIKIFGKTYKIVYVGLDNADLLDGKYGKVNFQTQTIYIDGDMAGEQTIDSFFHEVFHIVNSDLKLGLDEKQTQMLACAITDFLINNSRKMIFTEEKRVISMRKRRYEQAILDDTVDKEEK